LRSGSTEIIDHSWSTMTERDRVPSHEMLAQVAITRFAKLAAGSRRDCVKLVCFNLQERLVRA
jgi:hypothetical protein